MSEINCHEACFKNSGKKNTTVHPITKYIVRLIAGMDNINELSGNFVVIELGIHLEVLVELMDVAILRASVNKNVRNARTIVLCRDGLRHLTLSIEAHYTEYSDQK